MKIKRKTLERGKRLLVRAGIVFLIVGGFLWYTRTEFFTITSYDLRGVPENRQEELVVQLKEIAQLKRFFVIPGNKIGSYHKQKMIEAVHAVMTDASTITITTLGLHTVRVTATSLTPSFRLTDGRALTNDAVVFTSPKDLSAYPILTIASSSIINEKRNNLVVSVLRDAQGEISSAFLGNMLDLSGKVSSVIFPVVSIIVADDGDVMLLDARDASKVLFVRDADVKKIWSTLVSAIDTDPLKTKLDKERDNLLYLDVRFGNKVFYKFGVPGFQNSSSTDIMRSHDTVSQESISTQ